MANPQRSGRDHQPRRAQTLRLALVYALLDGKRSMDTPHILSVLGKLEAANKIIVEKQTSRGRPCTVVTLREASTE